jgi:predicted metalloprotease
MRIDNQRRSDNFQDRGRGSGGGGGLGGGGLARGIPLRGMSIQMIVIIGVVLAIIYFFNPLGLREVVFGAGAGQSAMSSSGSTCEASQSAASACDFSRAVLGSTEDVWRTQFSEGRLPSYGGTAPGAYQDPTLVVFSEAVSTGCGNAQSAMGPFYCPADRQLYIDPSFYDVMAQRLQAPGDFAQAYVIAHEVGHHVQNLIGATNIAVQGDSQNETSVRVELQADCFAGVWGHTAQATLAIDDADLREALNAAHQIGDDTLQRSGAGSVNPAEFTHGTSAQRMRWFRRGFDSGDARQCDTFNTPKAQL